MTVPPHPHTGLQTVSWLFAGEVEHRDSVGSHALIKPGELNLMTAGTGVAHSEVSLPDVTVLSELISIKDCFICLNIRGDVIGKAVSGPWYLWLKNFYFRRIG